MALTESQINYLKDVLRSSIRNKFASHNPEPSAKPFHIRLLGKDRLELHSFMHGLLTNFGITIFEPIAEALAKQKFKTSLKQIKSGTELTESSLFVIQEIIDGLETAERTPDKINEIMAIRQVCKEGKARNVKPIKVDLYLESYEDEIFLIDLKTVKPNMGNFRDFKRTLLVWVAVTLFNKPDAKINTLLAIPYNPYEPKLYNRWTMKGMIDLEHELKVAKEFWDFLGGDGAYEILLSCFEQVGIEMREEIDKYFKRFE
jgi:type II restriction enzyme